MMRSNWTLFGVVGGAIAALLTSASAGAARADLDSRILETARAYLAGGESPGIVGGLENALTRTVAVSALSVDSTLEQPVLTFETTGQALCVVEPAPSRDALILRLTNTIVAAGVDTMVVDGGNVISGVQIDLESVSPVFVTKVEVSLKKPATARIEQTPVMLRVTILPEDATPGADRVAASLENLKRTFDAAIVASEETARRYDDAAAERLERCGRALLDAAGTLEAAKIVLLETQLASITDSGPSTGDPSLIDRLNETDSIHSNVRAAAKSFHALLRERSKNRERINALLSGIKTATHDRIALRRSQSEQPLTSGAIQRFEKLIESDRTELAEALDVSLARLADYEEIALERLQAFESPVYNAAQRATEHRNRVLNTQSVHLAATESVVEGTLAELSWAVDGIRDTAASGNTNTDGTVEARLSALDRALETVTATAVTIPDTSATAFATLSDEVDADDSTLQPPAKRERPGEGSVSRHANNGRARSEQPVQTVFQPAPTGEPGTIRLAMAQEPGTGITPVEPEETAAPSPPTRRERTKVIVPQISSGRPQFGLYNRNVPASQDPLRQRVNIDFREMDLANVVSLLAQKGQINVIAGTDLSGKVTANLKDLPLGRAIEIVLRMNGLGIVEEAGVYRITSYEEAAAAQRETTIIFLENAPAAEVESTVNAAISGDARAALVSVSASDSNNAVIVSGPSEMVAALEAMVRELDTSEPMIPTITKAIKLNYSEPTEVAPIVGDLLSDQGFVTPDLRGRHVVVTDIPIKVTEIEALIADIDLPVKQVSIESMIVDAQLEDDAQTGIQWLFNTLDTVGDTIVGETSISTDEFGVTTTSFDGTVVEGPPKVIGMANFLPAAFGSSLAFNVLSGDIDLSAIIGAEVRSNDAELLANPVISTVENKPATINITEEFPFQELTSTSAGGQIASTEFKEIGTVLEVTPRVTHDNRIITDLRTKQSIITGISSTGVPIEAKREANTTMMVDDGQTIFIGGLRRFDDRFTVRKTPILGDIPVINFFFTSKENQKVNSELLIFLTCHVLPDAVPELTPYEKEKYDKLGGTPMKVDGTRALVRSYIHPEEMRDPFYKWRRSK